VANAGDRWTSDRVTVAALLGFFWSLSLAALSVLHSTLHLSFSDWYAWPTFPLLLGLVAAQIAQKRSTRVPRRLRRWVGGLTAVALLWALVNIATMSDDRTSTVEGACALTRRGRVIRRLSAQECSEVDARVLRFFMAHTAAMFGALVLSRTASRTEDDEV
jgi:hypothetical protein